MKEMNHYWVMSGRPIRLFGLVSPWSFALFFLCFFSRGFIYPLLVTLGVDLLERYARMPPLEVARRLSIAIGLRFCYRNSRELGSSYRSRLWTYHFGHNIGDGLFFGIFHPLTVLCVMGIGFFYAGSWFFSGYDVPITIMLNGLCHTMFGFCLVLFLILLIRDLWVMDFTKSDHSSGDHK